MTRPKVETTPREIPLALSAPDCQANANINICWAMSRDFGRGGPKYFSPIKKYHKLCLFELQGN
jgi:hypothetical protein